MNNKTFDMIRSQLEIIEECQTFRGGTYLLNNFLYDHTRRAGDDKVGKAVADINSALYVKEMEAWKNAALWALSTTEEQRKEIKKAAFKRFYERGMSIIHLFPGEKNNTPMSWPSADEADLRAWLAEIMEQEQDSGDQD